jgi:NCS1 family nucleobase:cation symporter-1
MQNLFPKVKQRWLIAALGGGCFLVAVLLDITPYQSFLYLVGSFFVPLFGMLTAHFFVLSARRYRVDEFYRTKGAYWYSGGVNVPAMITWVAGIVAYHLANPETLGAVFPAWRKLAPSSLGFVGGSLPSFAVAFLLSLAFGFAGRSRRTSGLEETE